MFRPVPLFALAIVLLLGLPNAVGGWASRGQLEPETTWDTSDGMMHLSPNILPNRRAVYLNVFPVNGLLSGPLSNPNLVALRTQLPGAITAFNAMMGVWADCNRDGYIGNAESIQYVYPAILLEGDFSVCPLNYGAPSHNNGSAIREFIPIGPACNLEEKRQGKPAEQCAKSPHVFHDEEAKLWGDYGTPNKLRTTYCPGIFLPEGSLATLGAVIRYGDCELTNVPGWELTRQDPVRDGKSNPCLEPGREYHIVLPGNTGTVGLAEVCNFPNPYSSGEDRSALVFKCGSAFHVQDHNGRTLWTVPGPDFGSLWTPNPVTVDPDGSGEATAEHVFGDCLDQAPENYDMYAALEKDRPNDGLKRYTDWEFVFYEGGQDNLTGIKQSIYGSTFGGGADWILGTLEDFPMWVGTRSDAVWTNPYFDWQTKQPSDVENFTFYGYVGYGAQSAHALVFPEIDNMPYLTGICPHFYDVHGRVDCRPETWWQGQPQPHQAVPGQTARLRDVDCYDPYPPGTTRPPGVGICERPDPLLVTLAAGVDYNQDCLGDQWQSEFGQHADGLLKPFADLDNDSADNLAEFRWRTIPVETTEFLSSWKIMGTDPGFEVPGYVPGAQDFDRDFMHDGPEIRYWGGVTNEGRDCRSTSAVALFEPRSFLDIDGDRKVNQHDSDSDGDGLDDGVDLTYAYPELKDSDCSAPELGAPCPAAFESSYDPQRAEGHGMDPNAHGDKIPDQEEFEAWRSIDAEVRREFPDLQLPGTAWRWDIDGDRMGGASNLLDRDSDGDGLLDGDEWSTWKIPENQTESSSAMHWFDTDRDGLLDGDSVRLWEGDPRIRIWTDAGIDRCVPEDNPWVLMFIGEREYSGSLSNRTDNPRTPASGCGLITRSEGSPLWIAYTRLPDSDVPSEERYDFVREAVEQNLHDGREILSNVTTLAERCLAYSEYASSLDPAPLQENATVCANDARAYIQSLLLRTLAPTPAGPLAQELVLFVDEAVARFPDLTACLPQTLPALPPADPDLDPLECAVEAITAYTTWLLERTTRFVTSTLDSTIEATPLGPLVRSGTQTVQGILGPIASTDRILHTVQEVVQNPWTASDIVLGEASDVVVRTPGQVASAVLNLDNSSDPSQSFTHSLIGPTGLGEHWEAVRASPVGDGTIGAIDSLVYGVRATSDTHTFTRREQLDKPIHIDLNSDGTMEYTVSFTLNSELAGGSVVASPAMVLARNAASTYTYTQPLKVVLYYYPANSPYVLTLAASLAPDSMPTDATVTLSKFVLQKTRDRVLELGASTTGSTPFTMHAAAGGFEVDANQRPVPNDEVRIEAESIRGPASFRAKLDKVTSNTHALKLDVSANGAQQLRIRTIDGETIPQQSSPSVRIDSALSGTFDAPTTLLTLQVADLEEQETWSLVGTATKARVDHADTVAGVPSTFRVEATGATAASMETTQSLVSAQRASHTGGSVTWLHGYRANTCSSAQSAEYVRATWKLGVYCSTGRLEGVQSTTVSVVSGELRAETAGAATGAFLYHTEVSDLDEYGAALYATDLPASAKAVSTIQPKSRSGTWETSAGSTTTAVDFAATFPTQAGLQGLAFGGDNFPDKWQATAQADHFALEAKEPPTQARFMFAPNGGTVHQLAGVDHVSLKGTATDMAGSARLDSFPSFQATLTGSTLVLKGATDAASTLKLRFADTTTPKLAGVVALTPGAFDMTAAVAADGVLTVLTGPTSTSTINNLELGGPLGTHDVYVKTAGTPTSLSVRVNPAAGGLEASANARLSTLELSYAPKGTGKPTLGAGEQVLLTKDAQGIARAAARVTNVDHVRFVPAPGGVQLDLSPASAGTTGMAVLSTPERSLQLDYAGRPEMARAVFPVGKATLTSTTATGAIDARFIEGRRSSHLHSGSGEAVDATWTQSASSFVVSATTSPGGYRIEEVLRATDSQPASAWRLEAAAASPAFQLAMDDEAGIASVDSSAGRLPRVSFQRALGSDAVPTPGTLNDHVAVAVGGARQTTLLLHGVASVTARPSQGNLLPVLEYEGEAGRSLLVDIRKEANGQVLSTAHVQTTSRPATWSVVGDLAATSFQMASNASDQVGSGRFAFNAAGRWLVVDAPQGSEDLGIVWSETGLELDASRSEPITLTYGPQGADVPAPLENDLLLVVDTTTGTGGGRIEGIRSLDLTTASASVTGFARMAETLAVSVKAPEGTTTLKVRDFEGITARWAQGDALVDLSSPALVGSTAFARVASSGSTYAELSGLEAGTFLVTDVAGTLTASAPNGVANASMSHVVGSAPTVLAATRGAYYDASTGQARFSLENLKELVLRAPLTGPFHVSIEPTSAGFTSTPMEVRIDSAPDATFVGFTPNGTALALDLPRATGFDATWTLRANGTDGAFAYAATSGEDFIELNATRSQAPRLDIDLASRMHWQPGTSETHDLELRLASGAGALDMNAGGLIGALDATAGPAFQSGQFTADADHVQFGWGRGAAVVPTAPTAAQYLVADTRSSSGLAIQLVDARDSTWSLLAGRADVHTNASTTGSATIMLIGDTTSANWRTPELAGARMALHATSDLTGADPRWSVIMPTVPPKLELTYLHGTSHVNLTRDAAAPATNAEARMRLLGELGEHEIFNATNLGDTDIESVWGADSLRVGIDGEAGVFSLVRGAGGLATGRITTTTTPALLTVDYTRTANPAYAAPRHANTLILRTGFAQELHARLAGVTSAVWTTNETSFTYNETSATPQPSHFVWANGDRVAYARRDNASGAYNTSATLRSDSQAPGERVYEADSQSSGEGTVSIGVWENSGAGAASVTATAVAGRLQAFAGSAFPHVRVVAQGKGFAHGIVSTAASATSFSTLERTADQELAFSRTACEPDGDGQLFKVNSSGTIHGVQASYGAARTVPPAKGDNSVVAKCDEAGLHARVVAPTMMPTTSSNMKPCSGALLEDYVVPEEVTLIVPFARGTFSANYAVDGTVPTKLNLTVACDAEKDVRIAYNVRELATESARDVNRLQLTYTDLLPGQPNGTATLSCSPMALGGVCMQSMRLEAQGAPSDATVSIKSQDGHEVTVDAEKFTDLQFHIHAPTDSEENERKKFKVYSDANLGRAEVSIKRGTVETMPEAPPTSHHIVNEVTPTGSIMFFRGLDLNKIDVVSSTVPGGLDLQLHIDTKEYLRHQAVVDWDTSGCTNIWGRVNPLPDIRGRIQLYREVEGEACSSAGECTGEEEKTKALKLAVDVNVSGNIDELEFAQSNCDGKSHWKFEDIHFLTDDALREGRLLANVDYHGILAGKVELQLPSEQSRAVLTRVGSNEDSLFTIRARVPQYLAVEWDTRDDHVIYLACDTKLMPVALEGIVRDPAGWGFTLASLGAEGFCGRFVLDIRDLGDLAWVYASEKTEIPVAQYRGLACIGLAIQVLIHRYVLPECFGPSPAT